MFHRYFFFYFTNKSFFSNRNYLVFIDSNGNYCTISVTATSDNSAVTTHAFLVTRTSKYRIIREVPSIHTGDKPNAHCKENKEETKLVKTQMKYYNKKTLGFRKESTNKPEIVS